MNYFRFYVGDYLKDTSKLSLLDHGAYNQLLTYYYAEEAPLPLDKAEIYTMVRAMTPADRKAVDKVLGTYFKAESDGYHNARADHEIAVSRKARDNGAKGGRPLTEHETGTVTRLQTGLRTGEGGGSGHPPTTNHQPPAVQPPEKTKTNVGLAPDAARLAKNAELRKRASEVVGFLNEKTGRNFDLNGANADHVVARLKDGETVDDCRAVIAMKCRQWLGDPKMMIYLRPETLFNRTKFATYKGELIVVE